MADTGFAFKVENQDVAIAELRRFNREFLQELQKKAENMGDYFQSVQPVMYKDVMQHFRREEGPEGKWKPSKRALRQSGQTLQDTGRLRMSIVTWSGRKEARIGTNLSYAEIHQQDKKKYKKMPERKFIWLSDSAMKKIENMFYMRIRKTGDNL